MQLYSRLERMCSIEKKHPRIEDHFMRFIISTVGMCILLGALPAVLQGETYNGFYIPEFVRGQASPFIPIAATVEGELNSMGSGELRLKDTGIYSIQVESQDDSLIFEIRNDKGQLAGTARGSKSPKQLHFVMELFDSEGVVHSRGKLLLEAEMWWLASEVMKKTSRLHDREGHAWFDPEFDDSQWQKIVLPDDDSFGNKVPKSRLYRSRFSLAKVTENVDVTLSNTVMPSTYYRSSQETESISLVFASDDGIWIYINGRFLGHWGAREKIGGCVNDPLKRCGENGVVPPVLIPDSFLHGGENVIAVKVHNGQCCYNYFNMLLTRVRTRLLDSAGEP
jgi:hypothetical protein